MINSIIVQHLKHNKRLVVPGFGAFIKKDETGEVVFVEFLKKDDGVLLAALQQAYSLDRNEAMEIIENYVVNTKKHILTSGSFIIGSLGIMQIDANSVYNFDYQPNIVEQKATTTVLAAKKEQTIQATRVAQTTQTIQATQSVQPVQAVKQPERTEKVVSQSERAERQPERAEKLSGRVDVAEKQVVNERQELQTIDVKGLQYQKPIKPIAPGHNKRKTDMIMLIAIVAATIAIIAMAYGIFTSTSPELTLEPHNATQQTEADTTQVVPSK